MSIGLPALPALRVPRTELFNDTNSRFGDTLTKKIIHGAVVRIPRKESPPLHLIFVGPPGSGKGTQASLVSEKIGLKHLSIGDMLRVAQMRRTSFGLEAKELMESGKLVGDELVASIVADGIKDPDCVKGFILDGFPRTISQVEILDRILTENSQPIDAIISLEVPEELLAKRVTGRLVHPASGRTYNVYTRPPKVTGKDDITGEELVKRDEDTEDRFRRRLIDFMKTEMILQHYRSRVICIDAEDDDVEVINRRIMAKIAELTSLKMYS